MSRRRLNEKQIAAIEYLALPQRGGLTYEEIAEKVGIARSTLQEWRKDETFQEARKRRIIENTQDHLPDVFEAAVKGITEDRNAAIFRTFLQAHGMLTEKHEIDTGSKTRDMDDIRAKIESMRSSDGTDSD